MRVRVKVRVRVRVRVSPRRGRPDPTAPAACENRSQSPPARVKHLILVADDAPNLAPNLASTVETAEDRGSGEASFGGMPELGGMGLLGGGGLKV